MANAAGPLSSRLRRLLALPLLLVSGSALAQPNQNDPALRLIQGGGTPSVYDVKVRSELPLHSCPAIVNKAAGDVEPLRISSSEVALKNRMGCLSPNDAIYGADGCPLKLCSPSSGVVPLPAGAAAARVNAGGPQLPEP